MITTNQPLDPRVRVLCQRFGWTPGAVLRTGTMMNPYEAVVRVSSEVHGQAVLRVGSLPHLADFLGALSATGVTPHLLESGELDGDPWVLVEWIDGAPLCPDTTERPDLETLLTRTPQVLAAMKRLHVVRAEVGNLDSFYDEFEIKAGALARHFPGLVIPPFTLQLAGTFGNSFRLHGDVLPQNVIGVSPTLVRFIDPRGGVGPPEYEASRWLGFVVWTMVDALPAETHLEAIEQFLAVSLGQSIWLDHETIRLWITHNLVVAAGSMLEKPLPDAASASQLLIASQLVNQLRVKRFPAIGASIGRNQPCLCGSGMKSKHCPCSG